MNNYYVYTYLDPVKNGRYRYGEYEFDYEPFYIGKGKDDRWMDNNHRSKYFKNKINKIKSCGLEPLTIKIKENMIEDESFILESKSIKLIGRKDLENGPLINFTDGGEGISGYVFSEGILEKKRKNFSDIIKEFEKRGYKLLTEEKDYKNAQQKLNYICDKGHDTSICWNNFQKGQGCPYCFGNKIYFSDIKLKFEEKGYMLLTKEEEYKNSKQKLNCVCPKGDNKSISWSNFKGQNCLY